MIKAEEQQQSEIGSLIGDKYRILCRIGGGGMAQVLLARHRFHGGLFAVKILADHLAQDPSIVARFKQEATTAASLSGHPNIVTIFDIGEGRGVHYLIMQFVCGEDLAGYLRREGRLSPPAAAGVITQVAEALCWAESKHVVHRDLKPANIHLDTSGRIKILDFGISKITDLADSLTRPGESLGTPFYMSPEQIRGERCDVRSDLYSLGVVFFELLTGRRPFENESVTAIQMAHLSTPPPLVCDFDPGLPPMCEHIVQKLLRKNPAERYGCAQELLDELHANGASSGPTTLRPLVDPGLQDQIDRAEVGSHESVKTCVPTPVEQEELEAPATAFAEGTTSPAAPPVKLAAEVTAEAAAKPERRSRRQLIPTLFMGAALLALTAGSVLFFLYRKPPREAFGKSFANGNGFAKGEAPVLGAVLEDAHGRMLLVPAGEFIFGHDSADSPRPKQTLSLPAFYIDETEVSNAEYLRFAESAGRTFRNSIYARAHPTEPATGVSASDAEAYAAWAGKRLPREEEWEKAARGSDGRPFPWGSDPWVEKVPESLQPVDSFPERKSPVGALNMAGNAWEWTTSEFPAGEREIADMRQTIKTDSFSRSWLVIKGGSFQPHGSGWFRVYLRRGFPPDQPAPVIGFRCVKDAVTGS